MSAALDIRVGDVLTMRPADDVVATLRSHGMDLHPSAHRGHFVVIAGPLKPDAVEAVTVAMSIAARAVDVRREHAGAPESELLTRTLDAVARDLEGEAGGVRAAQRLVCRRDVEAFARAALDFATRWEG